KANKRFKRDSQRVAFLPCVGLCDYEVMRQVGNSVGCPLSGRYVYLYFNGLKVLGSSSLSLWQFVPSRLSKSALSA
ncbi:hypothetical protein ACSTD7_21320, partial [Vibrio vulnificus]